MSGALALRGDQQWWDDAQLAALQAMGIEDAPNGDRAVFLHVCQRTGLDPFVKQIYMIGRWDGAKQRTRWTIQTGIDGLRLIARRTGEFEGRIGPWWCGTDGAWSEVWLGDGPPVAAKCGVRRRGFPEPVYAVVLFREYVQTTKSGEPAAMWRDKAAHMIGKVAEAAALRAAFPAEMSGLLTDDETARTAASWAAAPADQPTAPAAVQAPSDQPSRGDWDALVAVFDDLAAAAGSELDQQGKLAMIGQILGRDVATLKGLTRTDVALVVDTVRGELDDLRAAVQEETPAAGEGA